MQKSNRTISPPLVTVVTIVKNGINQIGGAIDSVKRQDYPNIEYIIKDGISTDGTINFIKEKNDGLIKLISRSDSGISDAWNQALEIASGDYIALLNSDDAWSSDFISQAIDELMSSESCLVFGDTVLINGKGDERRVIGSWSVFHLWKGIGFLHPSVVATRKSYLKFGGFRTDLRYAMDTDWIIRLHASGCKFSKHKGLSYMATDGISNRHWIRARREYLSVLRDNNISLFFRSCAWLWLGVLWAKKNIFIFWKV